MMRSNFKGAGMDARGSGMQGAIAGGVMLKSLATFTLATASLLALGACQRAEPPAAPVAAAPQHPDFSGLYFPAGRQQDPQRPEYTPGAAAALASMAPRTSTFP